MPYLDKDKQRQAARESAHRCYHADGSTRRAYVVGYIRAKRLRAKQEHRQAVTDRLLAAATQRAKMGYSGTLTTEMGFR